MDKSNWFSLRLPPEKQVKLPLKLHESEIIKQIHQLEQLHEQDPVNREILDRLDEMETVLVEIRSRQGNLTYQRRQKAQDIKQDRVHDISVIKDLLACMSGVDPPFIDPESARNYQAIYEGHFKDLHQLSTSERTPQTCINWVGTWAEYDLFYLLLRASELIASPFLDISQNLRPNMWFSGRCVFHGKPKTNKQVGDSLKNARQPINDLRMPAMFIPFLQLTSEHQGNVPALRDTFNEITKKLGT